MLCSGYREKIAQHAANNNDNQKFFSRTGQQGPTQFVEARQEMIVTPAAVECCRDEKKGGAGRTWTEVQHGAKTSRKQVPHLATCPSLLI